MQTIYAQSGICDLLLECYPLLTKSSDWNYKEFRQLIMSESTDIETQENSYNGKQKKQKKKWQNQGNPQVVPEDDENERKKRDPKKKKNDKGDQKNSNRFSESKNFIQTIADVSLMMANISQLRAVLCSGNKNRFYVHLLTLIILSLASHVLFVLFTVIRAHFNYKHRIAVSRAKTNTINKKLFKFCCCCKTKYRRKEFIDSDLCQCPHCRTDLYMHYVCYFLVFITICANIGITGIGISGDC
ncbi:TMEM55 [Mytilus edulis]|uniref:TMEM55 n=1 Tax=Mytilus edulis TaxID=6550 RepID=A0A8S3TL35_MYTED|nr:TMEM55 [Mytilus edulis]